MKLSEKRYLDVRVALVSGRVDHSGAEDFRQQLWPLLQNCSAGQDQVVLDLGGLEYISSAGLRVLMLAAREVKPRNGCVVVAGLQPLVQEIFEISRFNLLFKVYPDVARALTELSPAAAAAASGS